ncbi:DUF2512 family protein [Lentibacillus sediminis]|uniref:DUF2512 family protein n=1 Tax=Lentibacillus sediminis TaxID=1940529 RepID=UPI000C1C3DC6|nr:DUF2512 family protein [Lentibacillus sediminis]
MKYTTALLTKFIMHIAVLWFVLSVSFGLSFRDVLSISLIITIIMFSMDVFVLPKVESTVALIMDAAFTFIGICLLGESVTLIEIAAFISTVFITTGELFFHRYLRFVYRYQYRF